MSSYPFQGNRFSLEQSAYFAALVKQSPMAAVRSWPHSQLPAFPPFLADDIEKLKNLCHLHGMSVEIGERLTDPQASEVRPEPQAIFLGHVKAGKSTAIRALTGCSNAALTSHDECTSVPIYFRHEYQQADPVIRKAPTFLADLYEAVASAATSYWHPKILAVKNATYPTADMKDLVQYANRHFDMNRIGVRWQQIVYDFSQSLAVITPQSTIPGTVCRMVAEKLHPEPYKFTWPYWRSNSAAMHSHFATGTLPILSSDCTGHFGL